MPDNKKTRFLLVTYPNDGAHVEHFEDESALLDRYAEARASGVTSEAYAVEFLELELTARRKVTDG